MPETILETRALSRSFGGLRAVAGVSLAFERGVVHAVLGPNGAGKTTLINLLSGDLPPQRGDLLALCDRALVMVKGRIVLDGPTADLARDEGALMRHLSL